ncbi:hypothetical protein ABZU32_35575 [Sphaerisporangium sp. NPDC005288]|uniref:hypothetical protein n=1 Tax=Sphaerisporangium sp. NPDC005288 TaxID=3155114 RepID=UPI0033B8D568
MSWTNEDGVHEGWAATEFPGNRFSVGLGEGGALVRAFGPGPGRLPAQRLAPPEVVDGREAIGWRGMCECGWRGPLWQRVDSAQEHDTTDRRIWWPDLDQYADAPADVENAIGNEWRRHLPAEELAAVREHAQEAAAAQVRLTDAVHAAREAGHSWADIGEAVGITRQSAHERWARPASPARAAKGA